MTEAEEFLNKLGFMSYSLQHPKTRKFTGVDELMEAYHKHRVNEITDEVINNRFPVHQGLKTVRKNHARRGGAKWFKEQLLK